MNAEQLNIWKSAAQKSDGLVRIYAEDLLELIALAERTTSPVSEQNETVAVLPNGRTAANVYEAYRIGMEQTAVELAAPDTSQDWAKLDGATAFHLIERHAEDWAETGHMMESWLAARMAAAAPHAQAMEQAADPRPLFDRKLAHLQERGYEVIGRILHKDGEYALFDSSCRWLTQPQYWRLMHEQDGSLFATPPAIQQPQDERAAFEAWAAKEFGAANFVQGNSGGYVNSKLHLRWEAWQARAALAKKGGA